MSSQLQKKKHYWTDLLSIPWLRYQNYIRDLTMLSGTVGSPMTQCLKEKWGSPGIGYLHCEILSIQQIPVKQSRQSVIAAFIVPTNESCA